MFARCRCLHAARRLSSRPQALRVAVNPQASWTGSLLAVTDAGSSRGAASRSLSTQRELSTYLLTHAKILQLVTRTLLVYPQLASLEIAASPLAKHFAADCSMRERMFMFICSLVPPDEPLDIPEFLSGATHAVHAVYQQLYAAHLTGDHEESAATLALSNMATQQCVALWKTKLVEQKKALGLPSDATLALTGLNVRNAGLAEIEYSYSNAHPDQHADSQSVFRLNESLCAKVRFSVTEYVRASSSNTDDDLDEEVEAGAEYVFDTTFDWSFDSNVSRSSLVDWHIAEATPFVTKLVSDGSASRDEGGESNSNSESSQS